MTTKLKFMSHLFFFFFKGDQMLPKMFRIRAHYECILLLYYQPADVNAVRYNVLSWIYFIMKDQDRNFNDFNED